MSNYYLSYYLHLKKKEHLAAKESFPTLEELERDYIGYLLSLTGYNITETAKILHISRTALYQRLNKYEGFNKSWESQLLN
jgi:DNA-binding NtrC family response regulator